MVCFNQQELHILNKKCGSVIIWRLTTNSNVISVIMVFSKEWEVNSIKENNERKCNFIVSKWVDDKYIRY